MLRKILIVVAVLVVGLVAVISAQPSQYTVRRSAVISAAPEVVFPLINDFHNWASWSPWEKLDPAMKKTFEGSPVGTGSIYSWAGNSDVGEGRMTIAESKPNESVRIKLEFLKPFESTSTTDFLLKPSGGGTSVDWVMSGENNFIAKAFSLFMNMDKMVGGDFEKGLSQMKAVAESKK